MCFIGNGREKQNDLSISTFFQDGNLCNQIHGHISYFNAGGPLQWLNLLLHVCLYVCIKWKLRLRDVSNFVVDLDPNLNEIFHYDVLNQAKVIVKTMLIHKSD